MTNRDVIEALLLPIEQATLAAAVAQNDALMRKRESGETWTRDERARFIGATIKVRDLTLLAAQRALDRNEPGDLNFVTMFPVARADIEAQGGA